MKLCLTGCLESKPLAPLPRPNGGLKALVYDLIQRRGLTLATSFDVDPKDVREGLAWPLNGLTMIGFKRLDNIRHCIEDVLTHGIAGDVIEAGVWRGGAAIFMKAVLAANSDSRRLVWLADSFQGLPAPDPGRYPADAHAYHLANPFLAVSLDEVQSNFARYRLLDDRVRFVKGWFRETLPRLTKERFAVIRLDGDLYESTMDGLTNLYPSLSPGGYVIVDDYGDSHWGCRQAVDDFRSSHGITEAISAIDWTGVFWKRAA